MDLRGLDRCEGVILHHRCQVSVGPDTLRNIHRLTVFGSSDLFLWRPSVAEMFDTQSLTVLLLMKHCRYPAKDSIHWKAKRLVQLMETPQLGGELRSSARTPGRWLSSLLLNTVTPPSVPARQKTASFTLA